MAEAIEIRGGRLPAPNAMAEAVHGANDDLITVAAAIRAVQALLVVRDNHGDEKRVLDLAEDKLQEAMKTLEPHV